METFYYIMILGALLVAGLVIAYFYFSGSPTECDMVEAYKKILSKGNIECTGSISNDKFAEKVVGGFTEKFTQDRAVAVIYNGKDMTTDESAYIASMMDEHECDVPVASAEGDAAEGAGKAADGDVAE